MQNLISKENSPTNSVQIIEKSGLNIYQFITLNSASRLLSLLDRNSYSQTYGSFSRNYWHYKTTDFSSASDQQGVLGLTSLYLLNLPENSFYKNNEVLKLIEAAINYWSKIQLTDGSFSEWYPNEHSHVATSFTSYAISETLLLLKESLSKKTFNNAIKHLKKAGKWLINNIDTMVLNHTAGAVAALYNIYLLTNENIFNEGAKKNLFALKELQDSEGWIPEYSGADPGYLGVSIDYLAKYWHKCKDKTSEEIINKALNFLVWFYQDTRGTTGGEYGSRNVKYILPHGLALLSNDFPHALWLENKFEESLINKKTINPETIDDRYFLFFHYPNYALTSLLYNSDKGNKTSRPDKFLKYFSSSGLITLKENDFHIIVNLKKGGIASICTSKNIFSDCGYFIKIKDSDTILTSQTSSEAIQTSEMLNLPLSFTINLKLVKLNTSKPYLSRLLIFFRIFNYTIGHIPFLMNLFNNYIKKKLIAQSVPSDLISLERKIIIETNKIIFDDVLTAEKSNILLEKLSIEPNTSIMHVPTSKYYTHFDLERNEKFNPCGFAEEFNKKGCLKLKRVISIIGQEASIDLVVST